MKRYAAKILHQLSPSRELKRQLGIQANCIETIINYYARGDASAVKKAEMLARRLDTLPSDQDQSEFAFSFVGITDIIKLGIECNDYEVWYDLKRLKNVRKEVLSTKDLLRKLGKG